MKDFPQTWAQSPLLSELPPKYKIYPEKFTTVLPEMGEEYSRRPGSQYVGGSLFQSSLSAGDPLGGGGGATGMASTIGPAGLPDITVRHTPVPPLDASSIFMTPNDLADSKIAQLLLDSSQDESLGPSSPSLSPLAPFAAALAPQHPPSGPSLPQPRSSAPDVRPLNP
jgi:hypothetical protein